MIPIRIAGTQPPQGFNYTNIFDPSSSLQNISRNINPNKRRLPSLDEDGYEENRVTKTRKLKIYSLENKLDIIDYAKVIGNRAAGREFNVAESSIREWRKNESKIKDNYKKELLKNSESNELLKAREILSQQLDTQLIDFINAKNGKVTWYDIKYKAEELECQYKCVTQLDITKTPINMGWVSRFMKRVMTKIPHVPPPSNSNHNLVQNNQNNFQNGNVSQEINNSNPILPPSILQFLNIQQQQRVTTNNNNNLQSSQQQSFILDQNVITNLIHQFNLQKQQQQQNCILSALLASQQNSNKLPINYSPSSISTINNNNTNTTINSNGMANHQINPLHLQSLLQVENLNILQLINNITNGKINNFSNVGISQPTPNNNSTTISIGGNNNNNNIISSSTITSFDGNNIKYPLNNTTNSNNNNILKNLLPSETEMSDIQRMILNANIMISSSNNNNSNINTILTKKSTIHKCRRKGCTPKKTLSPQLPGTLKFCSKKDIKNCILKEQEDIIKQSDTEDSMGGCDSSSKTSDLDSVSSESRKMEIDVVVNNKDGLNNTPSTSGNLFNHD
ncbi:Homeodomain-like-containing protein [Strongyloides ratti]|uniref:Homeodomain-like-containing protein n=1 Tax=Strongyloides ratti TaxID=34506 RepID=A0A090MUP1_STRRB|nr:Homeodomain-like-containing protein [Strongyloides ratti]CEF62338.1 Homeodomain-like-containing protein [Strongyloides ratti]